MTRWTAWPAWWLGLGAWLYAALSVLELRELDYDPTAPEQPDQVTVAGYVPELAHVVAVGLGVVLLVAVWSLATGRAARVADVLLGVGAVVGGWFLWAVDQPRPVAPWLVAGAGVLALLGALLPLPTLSDRARSALGRALLVVGGVPVAWVAALALEDNLWQVHAWTAAYWTGFGVGAAMVLGAVLGSWRDDASSWSSRTAAVAFLGLGVILVGGGVLGFEEGYLVSGHEESEDGWYLGGIPLFGGLGVLAAGVAALRARWALVALSLGGAAVVTISLVVGVDEVRNSLW